MKVPPIAGTTPSAADLGSMLQTSPKHAKVAAKVSPADLEALAAFLATLGTPEPVSGESLGPLFEPPTEPSTLPYVIALFAAITIGLSLFVLVRGRLLQPGQLTGSYLALSR